jgi:hypothetical protein
MREIPFRGFRGPVAKAGGTAPKLKAEEWVSKFSRPRRRFKPVKVCDLIFNLLSFFVNVNNHVPKLQRWARPKKSVLKYFMEMSRSEELGLVLSQA